MKRRSSCIFVSAVLSSCITYLVMSVPASRAGVDSSSAPKEHSVQANGVDSNLVVDEHDMRWSYINSYRVHTTAEEVILDLGFNMLDTQSKAGEQQMMIFRVPNRVIMSYPTAKRLQGSLERMIERYERQFGEIKSQDDARK